MAKRKNDKAQNNNNNETIQANTLAEMPNEILISGIIPNLEIKDFVNLSKTAHRFYALKQDLRIQKLYAFFSTYSMALSESERQTFLETAIFQHDFEKIEESFFKITSKRKQNENNSEAKTSLLLLILKKDSKNVKNLLGNINFSIFFQTDTLYSPFSIASKVGDIPLLFMLIEYDIKRQLTVNKKIPPIYDGKEIKSEESWTHALADKNISLSKIVIEDKSIPMIDYYREKDIKRYVTLLQKHLISYHRGDRVGIFVNSTLTAIENEHFDIAKFFLELNLITNTDNYSLLEKLITQSYNAELCSIVLKNIIQSNNRDPKKEAFALKCLIINERMDVLETSCELLKDVTLRNIEELLITAIRCKNRSAVNQLILLLDNEAEAYDDDEKFSLKYDEKKLINAAIESDDVTIFIAVSSVFEENYDEYFKIATNQGKKNIVNYLNSFVQNIEIEDPMEKISFRS